MPTRFSRKYMDILSEMTLMSGIAGDGLDLSSFFPGAFAGSAPWLLKAERIFEITMANRKPVERSQRMSNGAKSTSRRLSVGVLGTCMLGVVASDAVECEPA